jgi:S-(hydroxymethyl)glutathione dehydrogenase/alcohol dehydrogenase
MTGSYYGSADPHTAIAELAALISGGRLDLEDVVSHVIKLDDVELALERLRRGEGARSVVAIDPELAAIDDRLSALAGSAT